MSNITKEASQLADKLIGLRRDFHRHAESGFIEYRTASIVAATLTELGYEVKIGSECQVAAERMGLPSQEELDLQYIRALEQGAISPYVEKMQGGMTAVVGILHCGDGPVVGMRFDMDAVDMPETTKYRAALEGFNSLNSFAMHSCGHDSHTAIGLGVAELLMAHKDELKGTVKLIFQPAEEGVRGAKSIVSSGILDDVKYLLAGHVASGSPVGTIYPGRNGMLATYKLDAIFRGAPAHAGGQPQAGRNALLAGASAVTSLLAIPRHSGGATRINIGRFNSGTGRNVIPDEAHLALETRGATSELNQFVYDYAIRILENTALMHGCELEIKAMGGAKNAFSDEALMQIVGRVANELGCFKEVMTEAGGGGGSEDYTYMMERVQANGGLATFIGIGAMSSGGGHHTSEFDIDESCIDTSAALFTAVALDIMK